MADTSSNVEFTIGKEFIPKGVRRLSSNAGCFEGRWECGLMLALFACWADGACVVAVSANAWMLYSLQHAQYTANANLKLQQLFYLLGACLAHAVRRWTLILLHLTLWKARWLEHPLMVKYSDADNYTNPHRTAAKRHTSLPWHLSPTPSWPRENSCMWINGNESLRMCTISTRPCVILKAIRAGVGFGSGTETNFMYAFFTFYRWWMLPRNKPKLQNICKSVVP